MVTQTTNSSSINNNSNSTVLTKRVATGPTTLNESHIFSDADAKDRMRALNNDIYESTKTEKRKPKRNYLKIFLTSLFVVLGGMGIKKLYHILKKK